MKNATFYILPALNEEASVAAVISGLKEVDPNGVVVVVDDASTDSTILRAASQGACVLPLVEPSQVLQRRVVVAYVAVAEANRACWCCFACACVVHLSFVHLGCHVVVVETATVTVVAAVVSLAQVNAACALGEVAARRPHLHRQLRQPSFVATLASPPAAAAVAAVAAPLPSAFVSVGTLGQGTPAPT